MHQSDSIPDLLATELADLRSLWNETRSQWSDQVAEDFENHVIEPLHETMLTLRRTLVEHASYPNLP